MTIRRRVAFELATVAVLTAVFLVVVPKRPVWVDGALGVFAMLFVAATARDTREQIWRPLATARRDRVRHSWRDMLIATLVVAVLFAIIGRWTGRATPLVTATMLATLVPFALWATVQQVLFQFYLLGRLRALMPAAPPPAPAALNGLLFGAVHLPDVEVTMLTCIGGAAWSWYYLRDQSLGPIVVSHAVLGTTYYYWVRGEDLLRQWLGTMRW